MLRLRPRSAALLAAAAAATVPAALAAPSVAEAPLASVSVSECSRGSVASDRAVEFRGAMRRLGDSETMGMRFSLQERAIGGRFEKVRVPGLAKWRESDPGVLRFVHRQQVRELAPGAEYRVRVRFRWYDAGGQVVEEAVRQSDACRQFGDLPDR